MLYITLPDGRVSPIDPSVVKKYRLRAGEMLPSTRFVLEEMDDEEAVQRGFLSRRVLQKRRKVKAARAGKKAAPETEKAPAKKKAAAKKKAGAAKKKPAAKKKAASSKKKVARGSKESASAAAPRRHR